jgi:hypothetical protein
MIVRYNGHPGLKQMILEIADGMLAHRDKEGAFFTEIHFSTGEARGRPGLVTNWQVLLAAFDLTGEKKYLDPVRDWLAGKRSFDPKEMVDRYTERITDLGVREYIHTEGSIWIDRISANHNDLQQDRMGGIALSRIRNIYHQHHVSWRIRGPSGYESLGVFVTSASPRSIELLVYNMEDESVEAGMSLWDILPGTWRIRQGIDLDEDQQIDQEVFEHTQYLERGSELDLKVASRKYTIIHLELEEPAPTGYADRPDLAICPSGVRMKGDEIIVRVYSQGSIGTPETMLSLKDAGGRPVTSVKVPALEAPLDLVPRWHDVTLKVPEGTDLNHAILEVDPDQEIVQITRLNTIVTLGLVR